MMNRFTEVVPELKLSTHTRIGMKLLDYFFLLRPIVMIPIWFFFLIGLWHAGYELNPSPLGRWIPHSRELAALIIYSMIGGGIYIINQIYDLETDRANHKLFLLSDGYISLRAAWIYWVVLNLIGLAAAFLFSSVFFWCAVSSVLLGILYSARPFHFKGRPLLDMLSNAVGNGWLNTLAGYLVWKSYPGNFTFIMLPYMAATASVYLATTIADIPGDRLAGDRTTGVWLGIRTTGLIAVVLLGFSILISSRQHNWLALIPAVISFPFFIRAAYRLNVSDFLRAARICTTLMAIGIGLIFPWFILFLGVILLLSRWYYFHRFGLIYPAILTRDRT